MFHHVHGKRIKLYNNNKLAKRDTSEFNHGLVFSNDPLKNNHLFEVRIEKKVYSWSGGLEIGVTKCDPSYLEVPANATDLKQGTWVLSGNSILKDGRSVKDIYGINLNVIEEGDVLGVMKTDQNELVFYLNGQCKGIAAYNLPYRTYAVMDLYGQITAASIISYEPADNTRISFLSNELDSLDDSEITEGNSGLSNLVTNFDERILVPRAENDLSPTDMPIASMEQIRFHSRCGTLAKISADGRTAERTRPLDEFNNGVVITHRPLTTSELYEIRIDRLIEKWSGSIEVGITVHNPDFLEFPPTMTNLKSGTIMMSGCGILTNGKATKRDYGDYNLDELMIGDRIGLLRKPSGDLHYFINGVDQGVAASNIPILFWGVVDLYGRTVMVTIVDRNERDEGNEFGRGVVMIPPDCHLLQSLIEIQVVESTRILLFHKKCGLHVAVINSNRTAYRPNALEDFNHGVVLTSRPLKVNEPFEVKLERVVSRWAGSIEIGVTSHSPSDLEFPSTMTNMRTGTWMMTGNGVMHNGTTVLDDYGVNLDRLQAGDRVGIVIKENGSLHLYVNGINQGAVNAKITTPMYGVIDLYGQAAQATILEYDSLCSGISSLEWICPLPHTGPVDMCFHYNHGKNVRVCNGGRTAYRTQPMAEFTNAIVICNRPLKNNELFAISMDKMINVWSGSVEAGVTSIKVDEFELPSTMTDLDHDAWMLSGSNMMKDGAIIKLGYALNLDGVKINSVIGLMRHSNGSLHYYLNGVDQGEACRHIPDTVYPVIDLYGQCSQVSIVSPPLSQVDDSSIETSHYHFTSHWADEIIRSLPSNQTLFEGPPRCFSRWCGKNIILSDDYVTATRTIEHNYGLVFSNFPLERDKIYEMSVTKWNSKFAGTLSFGVSNIIPERCPLPPNITGLKPDVWFLRGGEVWCNGCVIKTHYGHNLHWLQNWSTIGVKHCSDNSLHFYVNGIDQGVAANDVSGELYIVVDLYGSAVEITMNREIRDMTTSSLFPSVNVIDSVISVTSSATQETLACVKDRLDDLKAERVIMEYNLQKNFEKEKLPNEPSGDASGDVVSIKDWSFFQELRGRNIKLLNSLKTALRTESYNQGVVIVSKPLERDTLFQVKIDHLNTRWVSSLMIGILCSPLTRSSLPVTAFGFKKDIWLIAGDSVYQNGHKIKSRYGNNLETLRVSQKVGILVDSNDDLKLFIDEIDQGVAASSIPPVCYVILDIYGQCEQVTIASSENVGDGRLDPVNVLSPVLDVESDDSRPEPVSCEKADLDRHEKESPSEEDNSFIKVGQHKKAKNVLNKTNENNAVLATSSSSSSSNLNSETDFHSKTDKTNENNSVMASSLNSESDVKLNKTIENNAVIASGSNMIDEMSRTKNSVMASCSAELTSSASSSSVSEDYEAVKSRKSFSAEIEPEVKQSINCDHKASLDIANTMYIQAEKSNKSKNTVKNCAPSPLNERPILLTKQNPNCEYRLRCCRFKNFLGLPVGFFASDTSILCYCGGCCPYASQQQKGEPPVVYSLPNGWCKFPLKKHLMTNNVDSVTLEKWHVGFVGVSVGNVRRILDSGQLLAPDKLRIGCAAREKSKLKDDESNKCQIVLSPTIKYAINADTASNYKYVDQKTKTSYTCSAVFQVLVRPGSYKVGPPSSKISLKLMDPNFNANTIEWVIKEKESTVLSALLFRIENS